MSKYSRDLDESLVKEVEAVYNKFGLMSYGIELACVRLNNKKNTPYGEVLKSSDLVKLFAKKENLVVIAINEDIMDLLDEESKTILIEALFEKILVEEGKDGSIKISIKKDELSVGLGTYHKYGEKVIEKLELAILAQNQLTEKAATEKLLKNK